MSKEDIQINAIMDVIAQKRLEKAKLERDIIYLQELIGFLRGQDNENINGYQE